MAYKFTPRRKQALDRNRKQKRRGKALTAVGGAVMFGVGAYAKNANFQKSVNHAATNAKQTARAARKQYKG